MAKNKNNKKGVRIQDEVRDFAEMNWKKFKKQNKDYYDSKKDMKYAFFVTLIDLLPETIEFVVKYGYINREDIQEIKNAVYAKINDPDFIKILSKEIDNGAKIDNIKLLPIAIKEILIEAKKYNDQAIAQDPNAAIYDMRDLSELSQKIMKKKLKKMKKAGISNAVAFDVLSTIPCEEALESSQFYRIHGIYDCLYEHAKGSAIPFAELMDVLVDEEYYPLFITFALLERKEKFAKLTDNQKQLYVSITNWCFDTMERLSKEEIEGIITTYVNNRKRDEAQGKDGNRRYSLSSLSEDDYEKIRKVITRMVVKDDSISKYL